MTDDDNGFALPEMNLFEAILNRRTCKSYSQRPIEFEKIVQVVQAAMHAPSAGNRQNWQFTIITDRSKLQDLYHCCMEQDVLLSAPMGILVTFNTDMSKKFYGLRGSKLYSIQDCACAIQNMSLAAESFGLRTTWIGAFDEEKIASMFGVPGNVRAQAIILLGYPDDEPEEKRIKSVEEVLFFNKFGARVEKPHIVVRDFSREWEMQLKNLRSKTDEKKTSFKESFQEQTQEATVKSKEFFSQAQERLNQALDNLKDEDKQKRKR